MNENRAGKQAGRTVKVMQLPQEQWKWLGRGALALAVMALAFLLIRSRAGKNEDARRLAGERLGVAAELVRNLQWQVPNSSLPLATGYMELIQREAEQANGELDQVASLTDDPKLLAQADVLRGNLNYALANIPELPAPTTATSQPRPGLKQGRNEYLALATAAFQEVLSKYPDQPMSDIAAHFGLAAIAENGQKWDEAAEHYKAILDNPESSPAIKQFANQRRDQLAMLKQPALLVKAPTTPLIVTTQPATTQSSLTLPATTQATTRPGTQLAASPATRPASLPAAATKPAK